MIATSDPKVFVFDIVCSNEGLKFPYADYVCIYMISIMINGQGYLIINRDFVYADIPDFEYTLKLFMIFLAILPNLNIQVLSKSLMKRMKKTY